MFLPPPAISPFLLREGRHEKNVTLTSTSSKAKPVKANIPCTTNLKI